MESLTIEQGVKAGSPVRSGRRREHIFYTGMAGLAAVTVFAGFAPTYFLRPYFQTQPLMPLLRLHGIVFSSWVVLYLTQTLLVELKRTDIHRRLGMVGAGIAVLMIPIGPLTALIRAQQGATPPGGPSPLVFLVIPLTDMLIFAILVGG